MRKWIFMLGVALATCACGGPSKAQRQRDAESLRQLYLEGVNAPFRIAIMRRQVIVGMEPFHVRMAKGEPCNTWQPSTEPGTMEVWRYCLVCPRTTVTTDIDPKTHQTTPPITTHSDCKEETLVTFTGGTVTAVKP